MEAQVFDDVFEAQLEDELQLVREAILMVASGAARRVSVASLRHGRVILEPARAFAAEIGVRITSLPTSDSRRVDIAVELSTSGIIGARA